MRCLQVSTQSELFDRSRTNLKGRIVWWHQIFKNYCVLQNSAWLWCRALPKINTEFCLPGIFTITNSNRFLMKFFYGVSKHAWISRGQHQLVWDERNCCSTTGQNGKSWWNFGKKEHWAILGGMEQGSLQSYGFWPNKSIVREHCADIPDREWKTSVGFTSINLWGYCSGETQRSMGGV